jgi:hypothetical protein
MDPFTLFRTKLAWRVALALLAGAVLLFPAAMAVHADDHPHRLRSYETTYAVPGFRMHLDLTITSDGSVRADGTIRLGESSNVRTLVAQGAGQANRADSDGDGVAGLVRLAAEFRDVGTDQRVGVVLVPIGPDIDTNGDHEVTLTIDGEPRTFLTSFRVSPERR